MFWVRVYGGVGDKIMVRNRFGNNTNNLYGPPSLSSFSGNMLSSYRN
jgi:hypothetical protein